jgi:hypothetical protein
VGTKIEFELGMNGFLVNGTAVVRTTSLLGMGIEFTTFSPNAREQLDSMICSLSASAVRRIDPHGTKTLNLPPIPDPEAAINALASFRIKPDAQRAGVDHPRRSQPAASNVAARRWHSTCWLLPYAPASSARPATLLSFQHGAIFGNWHCWLYRIEHRPQTPRAG